MGTQYPQSISLTQYTLATLHGAPPPVCYAWYDTLTARERLLTHTLRGQLGLDRAPVVTVGSRLEDAVRDWGELEGLCGACHGLPFLLSVRVRWRSVS